MNEEKERGFLENNKMRSWRIYVVEYLDGGFDGAGA